MANGITTAFWSVTVNNYDDRDLAIFQNGYPDYCREIVYTLEEGKEGTPHIQAWVKLQRQQRMSFVKKLFPGGHFKPLTSDEYIHNTKLYAQKSDGTTVSSSVHKFNDPIPDPVMELRRLCENVIDYFMEHKKRPDKWDAKEFLQWLVCEEHKAVEEKPKLAKFYVSPMYRAIKKEYWRAICYNICHERENASKVDTHTHTHTHTDEKISHEEGITNATSDEDSSEQSSCYSEGTEGEDFEDGDSETDEGCSEGSDVESCEEDD
jgi:hypothetical protein